MNDLATRALDEIQSRFQIDEEWMSREDDRISWVAHNLSQTISVTDPFESNGVDVVLVRSFVPVVKNVSLDKELVCIFLAMANRSAIGSAYFYDESSNSIYSMIKVVMHEVIFNWRCRQLQTFIIMQLIMAEKDAPNFAESVEGEVVTANRVRDVPDDMLSALGAYTEPSQQTECLFANLDEFNQAQDLCNQAGGFSIDADENGVTSEFHFSDENTALGQLFANQEHPVIGKGLLSVLKLDLGNSSMAEASIQANELNRIEAFGEHALNLTGAWSVAKYKNGFDIAYSSFLPNVHFAPTIISDVCLVMAMRVKQWEQIFFPDEEFKKSVAEIFDERIQRIAEHSEATKH